MNLPARHRKIILAAILLMAGIGFGLNIKIATAAGPGPIATGLGNAVGSFATKLTEGAAGLGIVYGILYGAFLGLTAALTIVGIFLDNVFTWNLTVNLSSGPIGLVANQGWTVMRDLVNGLFILIIIWIAFTIIFNLESFGGKKLLVRVIIAGLLINFSFAMVAGIFGFTNVLAKPFYDALKLDKELSVSGLIVGNSYIHQVAEIISSQGAIESLKPPPATAQAQNKESQFASLWHTLGVPQDARAVGPLIAGLIYIGLNAAYALGASYLAYYAANALIPLIINLIVGNAFLAAMVVALSSITIILALRIIAMILLAVFAPLAFLGYMTPKYGQRLWDDWLSYLFNWAFIAPVFYFLIYLSLFMLAKLSEVAPGKDAPFTANGIKMLNLTIFLVMLFASIRITRKMGGAIAETALTLGKQVAGFGLGVATGGIARGAGALARRSAPQIEKVFGTLGRAGIGIPVARRTMAYLERQKKQVLDRESGVEAEITGRSDDYVEMLMNQAVTAERKTLLARAIVKAKRTKLLKGKEKEMVDTATGIGLQDTLLEAFPHLANSRNVPGVKPGDDQDALNKTIGKIDDLTKVALPTDEKARAQVLNAILFNAKGARQLDRIRRENSFLYDNLVEHYQDATQRAGLEKELGRLDEAMPGSSDQKRNMLATYFRATPGVAAGIRGNTEVESEEHEEDEGEPAPGAATAQPVVIEPLTPQTKIIGDAYVHQLRVRGGRMPPGHTWRVAAGQQLPPGVQLSDTGRISGRPTAVSRYRYTIELVDQSGQTVASRTFSLTVNNPNP